MSKEIILQECESARNGSYKWDLYYFKVNRKRNNPYVTYKVRFKSDAYLSDYANNLLKTIEFFQLSQINDVQEYNGENTKISCDKLALNSDLLKVNWELFFSSIINPAEERFNGKVQGYLLMGKPLKEGCKSITFVKTGNPLIKLSDNKARFYSCFEDELDLVTDEYCRLYLTTDFIIFNDTLYTFNLNFEKVFNIEKTMLRIKENGIEKIALTHSISNMETFKNLAKEYKSAKTFVTLKQERINNIQDETKRPEVATMLNIELDENNKFIIDTAEKTSLFIRYICYKIFKDYETDDIIEVSNVAKLEIN